MVKSTITRREANCVKEYKTAKIIEQYKKELSLDVERFFNSDRLTLYQCPDTGYRFFYPEQLAGDSKFYEQLQNFDWYYIPWKWEHEITAEYLKDANSILEVGCGQGGFIQKISLQNDAKEIVGLELNEDAAKNLSSKGFRVLNKKIQDFALEQKEHFDLVCLFQVLEHIYDIKGFVQAMIDCLIPGGKLVIAVPDNHSFIRYDEGGILNFPPHHMGWWDIDSLTKLGNFLNLNVEKFYYEPLQAYHTDWYLYLIGRKSFSSSRAISWIYEKAIKPVFKQLIKIKIVKPRGHSILVVYSKHK
jgi:SAM-dependent methyltransferase